MTSQETTPPSPPKEDIIDPVTIQFDDCSEGVVQLSGIDGEKLSAIIPLITAGGVQCTIESAN